MKEKIIVLVCGILLALSGCSNNRGTKHSSENLISKKWIFVGIRQADTFSTELLPPELKGMSVVFSNSKTLTAVSSCNTFYGEFRTPEPDSLKIGNLSTTKMFCSENNIMLWESRYFDGFKNSALFDFQGDTLQIISRSKTALLFKAE